MKVVLKEGAYMPERAHKHDAGADLRSPVCVTVPAHGCFWIDTGVAIQIPPYHCGMIKSRSSMFRKGLQSEGVVDTGYTGTLGVTIHNHTDQDYQIMRGDKIAQLVIMPIALPSFMEVFALDDTDRGEDGFGSTGR